jgi:hypothetical protein
VVSPRMCSLQHRPPAFLDHIYLTVNAPLSSSTVPSCWAAPDVTPICPQMPPYPTPPQFTPIPLFRCIVGSLKVSSSKHGENLCPVLSTNPFTPCARKLDSQIASFQIIQFIDVRSSPHRQSNHSLTCPSLSICPFSWLLEAVT